MNELKEQVIGYLNMGLNPTVISFQDDGLFYLFDRLLKGTTISNSYDPKYSFVHVALNDISGHISSEIIESRINDELTRDTYKGNTIIETFSLDNEVQTVCVLDDIAFLDNVPEVIRSVDNLIRKYRGILRFVYVVEDPMLIEDHKNEISASSSFLDALMYKEIGEHWNVEELTSILAAQFKRELDNDSLSEISRLSNNHFGTFKRLYKDKVLGLDSAERYAELIIEELDPMLLNTFKKVIKDRKLDTKEDAVFHYYSKVGFINNNDINIPLMKHIIEGVVIPDKISYNADDKTLVGIDLNEFNKTERKIIEVLFETGAVLNKSQIGDLIWGQHVTEKYSEWAIDQRIARLRKKIIDLGFNIDIQTIYGQGYKLTFINKR